MGFANITHTQAIHTQATPAPAELLSKATAPRAADLPYAGNIAPEDAYEYLQNHFAILVDVRTLPEWQFTGTADLSGTQGKAATISWKFYPDFSRNANFARELAGIAGIHQDTPLFFICRSGGRSTDAAIAMTAAGYRYCFNIEGGFEGEPDAQGHRGNVQGWKSKKLPWKQG